MPFNIKTQDEVLARGLQLVGYDADEQARVEEKTRVHRYKGHFAEPPICHSILWAELQETDIDKARLAQDQRTDKYFDMFMMAMYYLKTYSLELTVASRFDVHVQTVRKYVKLFVEKIAALISKYVVWPDDDEWDTTFIISVDCVNFGLNEPRHPTLHKDKKMFDRKNGKAGYTYEVALHLWENRVVWFQGPFPPNDGGDRAIFIQPGGLNDKIPEGKLAIADKIYKGLPKVALHNPLDDELVRGYKSRARPRQESINSRLKSFGVLNHRFRHGTIKHKAFAECVMVICVVAMENGSPLFSI